jgi:broad specificity phosphatase PhoE
LRTGETEWSKSGKFTGITDINLTTEGIEQVSLMAKTIVGAGKLIYPPHLSHVFVSPRIRAVETYKLLLSPPNTVDAGKVTYTEDIAEWDYGKYEGRTDLEIRAQRKEEGLDGQRDWDIWTDGCEGGEYAVPWSDVKVIANTPKISSASSRATGQADCGHQKNPRAVHAWRGTR